MDPATRTSSSTRLARARATPSPGWPIGSCRSTGADDKPVFDKVVVITDRVILDRQLQETIYQFEHATGVVARIDQDSAQLAAALAGEQSRIIITTLQKFPFILDKVSDLGHRRYAVIVDEAHSSQTGEAAKDLKAALGEASAEAQLEAAEDAEAADVPADPQDALAATVAARGRQPNLSFFAFTATPKARTLELFGRKNLDGNYAPFHLYSMRQAIEEGFILDVLANYTTYATYWKVGKAVSDDPEYDTRKARRAIARFVSLHPHNLAQKAEVIVEHFREHTRHKIGGRGKAMVVTSSRLHAVRYKQAIDAYIREKGYTDTKALVAFSGRVDDAGLEFTESGMNGFPESQTATRFNEPDERRPHRGREVPDGLRPAAPAHDVRGQDPRRASRRSRPSRASTASTPRRPTPSSSTSATRPTTSPRRSSPGTRRRSPSRRTRTSCTTSPTSSSPSRSSTMRRRGRSLPSSRTAPRRSATTASSTP